MAAEIRRRLVLLRHAKSDWSDPALHDRDRPLAARGQKAAPVMAAQLAKLRLMPDRVLCSTARRARETWDLIRPTLAAQPEEVFEPELYLAEPNTLLARIQKTPARITTLLVIGHNPGLQELALQLADRADPETADAVAARFPTAALIAFGFTASRWSALSEAPLEVLARTSPRDVEDEV